MKDKPHYRSVPTFRNYEDYHDAEQYTKGWNDAMDYIFPESKKAREKESVKKKLRIIKKEGSISMTKEEAIKILNTVLCLGKCDCPNKEIEECLKMAIKALEQ